MELIFLESTAAETALLIQQRIGAFDECLTPYLSHPRIVLTAHLAGLERVAGTGRIEVSRCSLSIEAKA